MKTTFKNLFLLVLITMLFVSCNQEELFVDPITEVVEEEEVDINDEDTEDVTIGPCDFNLDNVQTDSTILINCIMDLQGQTINLPANVIIAYEGGDIINGTLNFSEGTIISGELLNSTLTLGGSTPQLKDATFNFDPKRWGIVEGIVSDAVALNNREVIREIIRLTKELGASTFKIDAMDAYFKVDEPATTPQHGAINIPEEFNLFMTDNTHLRVQPNSHYRSALLATFKVKNVTIKGGNLHGDRDEHVYSSGHAGWGFLMYIQASDFVTIDGVKMYDAEGDGLIIEGWKHAWEVGYIPSSNILITNCVIDASRRNNLSIVDGHDIIVENSTFLNAGINTASSNGIDPRFAIDIEPVIGPNRDQPQQKVDRVIIRNCIEEGSAKGGFVAYEGDDILFTGNRFENFIAYNYATNVRIVDNPSLIGIIAGYKNWLGRQQNTGNVISGNTVKNGYVGIALHNQDIQVFNNNIINCNTGIQLDGLKNAHIYNNIIESVNSNSDGFNALDYVDDVIIEDNTINIVRHPLLIDTVNHTPGEEDYNFTFLNNTFNSNQVALIANTIGIKFDKNTVNNTMRFDNCRNLSFTDNKFNGEGYYSVLFRYAKTDDINFENNEFENPTGNGIIMEENTSSENKNFTIKNNIFQTAHRGMIINKGFNGMTIVDNQGNLGNDFTFIYYRGDNALFTNNQMSAGKAVYDIEGLNNVIN